MYSRCSVSIEFNWKDVLPTHWIEYVELSPNSTMHANCFYFMLEIAPLYPDMCFEAPLSINNMYSFVMRDPYKVEMR